MSVYARRGLVQPSADHRLATAALVHSLSVGDGPCSSVAELENEGTTPIITQNSYNSCLLKTHYMPGRS